MAEFVSLPAEVTASLGSESKDFSIKAARFRPIRKSLSMTMIGLLWTVFLGFALVTLGRQFFQNGTIAMTVNGMQVSERSTSIGFILFTVLFFLLGIGFFGYGVYMLFKKGGYFVGTPTRLIVNARPGNVRSIDWEQFSGSIDVHGNDTKGSISLQLRTGNTVRQKGGTERYIPDVIDMVGIPNVHEIERLCRKRIKENDPTQASHE